MGSARKKPRSERVKEMCVSVKMPKLDVDFICCFPNLIESD